MHSNSKNFLFCTFFGFFQYKLTVNVQTTSILGKYANRKIGTYMKRSCSGSVVLEFCSHFVEIDNGKNVRLKLVLSWPCMNSKYPLVTIILFAKWTGIFEQNEKSRFQLSLQWDSWAGTEIDATDIKLEFVYVYVSNLVLSLRSLPHTILLDIIRVLANIIGFARC